MTGRANILATHERHESSMLDALDDPASLRVPHDDALGRRDLALLEFLVVLLFSFVLHVARLLLRRR